MKKFLSLVLALVMTMSLVTVSAGAKDFTDASKINYDEAVTVMSAAKVIDGYADGTFNPSATLTRGAAAKIICNLILGPTTASALVADAAPYKDVPSNHTFAGYIAYCQKTGIISGYADGTFKPANTLTGYAFMKMLLGALGYNAETEGYTGANWSINVAKRAINAGLNAGLKTSFNGVKAVTREEACLYAFNTLKATMVEYENDSTITVNGVTFTNKSTAKEMENTAKVETIKDDNKMQFAEKYFDKLVKKDTTDDFGRPSAEWTYDKTKVGTFVDYTTMVQEFTTKVTYKDLYDAIGSSNLKNNDFVAYVDGVDQKTNVSTWTKTNKNTAYSTGNGVLTQVFVDTDKDLVTVAVINTYLAQADANYSVKNDKVNLTVYGVDLVSSEYVKTDKSNKSIPVYGEDVAAAKDLKKDDFVLVTVANKEIQTIAPVETVNKTTITNFKTDDYVTAAGTKYEYADSACYDKKVLDHYDDKNMKDTTYNLFLDAYGYVIGVEIVDEVNEYVFITGYQDFSGVLNNAETTANAIFMDGTTKTITVKVDSDLKDYAGDEWDATGDHLVNAWYTYSVDKNGKYELELVAKSGSDEVQDRDQSTDGKEINKSHTSLKGSTTHVTAYGNENTVYLTAKIKEVGAGKQITKADSVVVGVKNASMKLDTTTYADLKGAYYLYDEDRYVIAAVVVGKNVATSDSYVFVNNTANYEGYDAEEDEYTWTAEGIRNGEKVTLTEKGSSLKYLKAYSAAYTKGINADTFYKFSYDADGNVMDYAEPIAWVTNTSNLNSNTYAVSFVDVFNNTTAAGYDKDDVDLVQQIMKDTWTTELTLKGHTLYVNKNTTDDYALDIAPDAKAVLKDQHDGKWETEYFNAESGNVKAAIDELENTNFNGVLYAVMKDGVVTTLIIVDNDPHTGTGVTGKPASTTVTGVSASYTGTTLTINVAGAAATDKNEVVVSQLVNGVETVVSTYTVTGATENFTTTLADGAYKVSCGKFGGTFSVT